MARPDLPTLACVNTECQLFGQSGQDHLVIRKVYSRDRLRLLRCRRCGEEFSERRGTALFNTKLPESKAEEVINHLDEGWSVRATARLTKVAKETVARLLRSRYAVKAACTVWGALGGNLPLRGDKAPSFDSIFVQKTQTLRGA